MITLKSHKKDLQKYIDYVEAYNADYETPDSLFHQQPCLLSFKEFLISKLPEEEQNQNSSIEFREENFENISFTGIFEDCFFINCSFKNTNFIQSSFKNCNWTGNYFSDSTLTQQQTSENKFYLNNFCSNNIISKTKLFFFSSKENFKIDTLNPELSLANLSLKMQDIDSIIDDYVYVDRTSERGIDSFSCLPSFTASFTAPVVDAIKHINSNLQDHASNLKSASYICAAVGYFCGSNFLVNSTASTILLTFPSHAILASVIPTPVMISGSLLYIGLNAYKAHYYGHKAATMTGNLLDKIDIFTNGEISQIAEDVNILDRLSNLPELEKQKIIESLPKDSTLNADNEAEWTTSKEEQNYIELQLVDPHEISLEFRQWNDPDIEEEYQHAHVELASAIIVEAQQVIDDEWEIIDQEAIAGLNPNPNGE